MKDRSDILGSNSLAVKRPDLVELLVNKDDAVLTCGSNRKVRWWCENGEEHWFEMSVSDRIRFGCGFCSGNRVLSGFNDLATVRPDIAKYFNVEQTRIYTEKYPEKKWATIPEEVTVSSNKRAVWDCENGFEHYFDSIVNNRARGYGCPVCAGKKIIQGFNDLASQRPDIARFFNVEQTRIHAEKHPEKKWATIPEEVSVSSNKRAVWDCENGEGHWYETTVNNRLKRSCGVCSGFRVWKGFNDLATVRPDIAQYFNVEQTRIHAKKHPGKKWAVSPEKVNPGSNTWAVWDCENGEQHWHQSIVFAFSRGQGCAVCAGKQVFYGFNDLATLRPEIAGMWDYRGNTERSKGNIKHPVSPEEVTISSGRMCLWICVCGKVFERTVSNMTSTVASLRCPSCTDSQGERELAEFIVDLLPGDMETVRNDRTVLKPNELDIYIPELNLAFEFNGDYWHSNEMVFKNKGMSAEEWHAWKLTECANQDIDLFFVWESDWNDWDKRAVIEKQVKTAVNLCLTKAELAGDFFLLNILSKG